MAPFASGGRRQAWRVGLWLGIGVFVARGVIWAVPEAGGTGARSLVGPSVGTLEPGQGRVLGQPWISASMPFELRRKLTRAFPAAARRIRDRQPCRELFSELAADGQESLRSTFYYAATSTGDGAFCREGIAAFTVVGGRVTRLCDAFGSLSDQSAVIVLIHEALHQAGLGERPLDPRGPTSSEINRWVKKRCW